MKSLVLDAAAAAADDDDDDDDNDDVKFDVDDEMLHEVSRAGIL